MQAVLARYPIKSIWHFTDEANLDLIQEHGGLLSIASLQKAKIQVPSPGGNEWSHEADRMKGMHDFVHLAWDTNHPMLFRAKEDGRIKTPVWLEIDASVLLQDGTRFTSDVSNKSGVQLLTPDEAAVAVDFEVLFTRTDWRQADIRARLNAARKSEVLVPMIVPLNKICGVKYG